MSGEATAMCTRSVCRGKEGSTLRDTRGIKWGPSRRRLRGKDPASKIINRWEGTRSADEAIVAFEAGGQYNPLSSEGPLDWTATAKGLRYKCPLG